MPGLLDAPHHDLAQAVARLRELQARARQLLWLALLLAGLGGGLTALGPGGNGVPLLIGAAAALALRGMWRGDRRRLLVVLVAQGDAWSVDGVAELAERLLSSRERRRLAHGLRAAASAGATGAQVAMMVDPARAADVRDRLEALAERVGDPLVELSAEAAAICRRLLCDPQHSPLYNRHVPERELRRTLELLERAVAELA